MTETDADAAVIPKYPRGLRARGKRLWRELHGSADFSGSPEVMSVIEEACYLTDEIDRLRRKVRAAGDDTRVAGYNGQLTSMPEVDDLRKTQTLFLSMLKSIRVDADAGDGKMTRSQSGQRAADARWHS
ncbi:hypothetical protein MMAD_21690 [Mycolicibacterium madagascariense]|uniref:Uncharacterized protein n=1 Tax=Mycolicibacterium madagascariense TaxID=212765 RepID=A0A7I7XFA3_9MYCO|nr:hypothetical protein [Mycolicibacterium madagascariense]MCV7015559.1 hypothetical protein [Mycolicibacterium madagascariense]BBZ27874.1 hypothetical protein MMAD_21690 [Mycolicibacterium madagascariense]